ncbi:MAG: beta-phosphoglucomutase [Clostridiales bacterium]|jgi:alpha,alpha-trehalose phosphorylase|nr:beta-phosphoglucomutase [Clostridiales bacterium]
MKDKYIYSLESPALEQDELLVHETVFHNANGYIGVRSCFEEGYPEGCESIRGTYINAFYDIIEMKQAEKLYGLTEEKQVMLNAVDFQSIYLHLGETAFSMFSGAVLDYTRTLDMAEGASYRNVRWRSPEGREIEVQARRMASFADLPLFLIEYKLKSVNYEGPVSFASEHNGSVANNSDANDPRVAAEPFECLIPVSAEISSGASFLTARTSKSGLTLCTGVLNVLSKEAETSLAVSGRKGIFRADLRISPGEEVILRKFCVAADSLRCEDARKEAEELINGYASSGAELLNLRQRKYLEGYWESAHVEIGGDEELNLAMRYNMYQLLASAGKDEFANIAAKGLSGEGYEGHYFWDTEMYIEPFFNVSHPGISKSLLKNRCRMLPFARENAKLLGHRKGALYPWRTIAGKECSGYFPSGSAQYHINADIAYSVAAYFLATNDREFLENEGAEMLIETARLWLDAGVYSDGAFQMHCVTGPDEYTCLVSNNYYTNVAAKHNLIWAAEAGKEILDSALAKKLGISSEELEEFRKAAESMLLPYDEELGINPQDDSFLRKKKWDLAATPKESFPLLLHCHPLHLYRHQVCKQADVVLAHFAFEDAQSLDIVRNSFKYYESITTHDSSLSACIFSIVSARLGLMDKAFEYFSDSAESDLKNTHRNTKDGIHTANMGGAFMSIVYGFGGVRVKKEGIFFSPRLPKQWKRLEFKIRYLDSLILVCAVEEAAEFTLLSGAGKTIFVFGAPFRLVDRLSVPMENGWIPVKAVIFDLDGVVASTDLLHYKAWKAIADREGLPFTEEDNQRLRGVGRMESLEIILEKSGKKYCEEEKLALVEEKNNLYVKLLDGITHEHALPGARELADELRRRGILCAIGSSSRNARKILERIGLKESFDAVSDGNGIEKGKPSPEVFIKAAQILGVHPENCAVIEDARAGIDAALAMNAKTVAVGFASSYNKAHCAAVDVASIDIEELLRPRPL